MELTETYFEQVKHGLKRCLTPEQTQDYLIRQVKHAYITARIHSFTELVETENEKIKQYIKNLQTEIETI